eukprot:XP_014782477.1 PREDICTED: uncharacterized protein LOC106877921 isoform X2 [Octopus bimaculoides]
MSMLSRRLSMKLFRHLRRNNFVFTYRVITQPNIKVYGLTSKDLEFSTPTNSLQYYCTDVKNGLNANEYDRIAEETLESLLELIESFEDIENCPEGFDVSYSVASPLLRYIWATPQLNSYMVPLWHFLVKCWHQLTHCIWILCHTSPDFFLTSWICHPCDQSISSAVTANISTRTPVFL